MGYKDWPGPWEKPEDKEVDGDGKNGGPACKCKLRIIVQCKVECYRLRGETGVPDASRLHIKLVVYSILLLC